MDEQALETLKEVVRQAELSVLVLCFGRVLDHEEPVGLDRLSEYLELPEDNELGQLVRGALERDPVQLPSIKKLTLEQAHDLCQNPDTKHWDGTDRQAMKAFVQRLKAAITRQVSRLVMEELEV